MNAQIATIITFAGFVALPLAVIASKGEVVLLGVDHNVPNGGRMY